MTRRCCGREDAAEGRVETDTSGASKQEALDAEKSAQAELEEILGPETESLKDTPEEQEAAAVEAKVQLPRNLICVSFI